MPDATLILFGEAPAGTAESGEAGASGPPSGRICKLCGQRFSGSDARFCPFDGEPLDASAWDPSNDPLLGSVVDGRYEVMEVLGEGGMGTVYRVRHKALERPLALKALRRDLSEDADLPARFIQEAKAAAAVEHPNVVQITDFGSLPSGQPYFVMELLEGTTLARILRDSGPLSPSRTVGIAIQVAEALSAAHAAGVIHRDLKPDNIHVRRLAAHDVVKVLDFGLAKVAGTSRLTRAGMVFGTPHYMSPEQAAGEASDHRVDIYALGVLMFEMLTGRLPFEADSFTGVLAKHMYMDPPRPSEIVGQSLGPIEDITLRCMAKRPSDRYATMGDLLSELDRAGALLSVPPESSSRARYDEPTVGERLTPRFGRRLAVGIAVGLAVTVLAATLGAWVFSGSHDQATATLGSAASTTRPPPSGVPSAEVSATVAEPGPSADDSTPVPSPAPSSVPRAPKRGTAGTNSAKPAPGRTPKPSGGVGGPEIIDPWK